MPEIAANLVDINPYRRSAGDRSTMVEFLPLRRRRGEIYEGEWRMVAGMLESGETAIEAAHRELFQQTGLGADLCGPFGRPCFLRCADRPHTDRSAACGAIRLSEEHDDFHRPVPEWQPAICVGLNKGGFVVGQPGTCERRSRELADSAAQRILKRVR